MKYQIGQKIVFTKDDYPFKEGQIATITEVEDNDYEGELPCMAKVGDRKSWAREGYFELLEAKQQPFKVGDMVKVIRNSDNYITGVGYIGTVTKIEDSFNERDIYINDLPVRSSDLELVQKRNNRSVKASMFEDLHVGGPYEHTFTRLFPRGLEFSFETARPKKKGGGYMGQLSKLAKKLLDPDTKALVKAGVLDSELDITDEGADFVLTFLVEKNKVELAKEARKQLREQKKEEDEE